MTAVRFGLYFVDAISLRMVVARTLSSDADVVIFDRYLYDELANLSLQQSNRSSLCSAAACGSFRDQISASCWTPIRFRLALENPSIPLEFLHSSRCVLSSSERTGGRDDHHRSAASPGCRAPDMCNKY